MRIRLGYVAISKKLGITASSTMTYAYYKKLGLKNAHQKLHEIILSNFRDLEIILNYNINNNISFYRLTSNLIPLLTHQDVKINLNKYKEKFNHIGNIIKLNNMRVDTHPDQFCVLNSVREEVVISSISILKSHQTMFKLLNYDSKAIIHIGSSVGGKKESIKRFENNFNKLDEELQKMIILENDDKIFNISNTLKLCERLKVPMVLDYHHHLCNNTGQKIEKYIDRIVKTWGDDPPKMHFSSPKKKKEKRSHNDYIDVDAFIKFIDKIKVIDRDIDIMLEAKMKDVALFKLINDLKEKTKYEFINESTFIIK
ncbi:MAG: UV DNA damage repair endonuclease UvsE [Bacilli bacterium]|nr:UV DNA damage repair endonuclease UvsE [Bacilli bacterium]